MRRHLLLEEVITPVVTGLGYVLWGLQYIPQGKHSLVRLYIDKENQGVTIDDCERVSRQVDAVLSVKRVVSEGYTLEVSSPGLDRLLFTPQQYLGQLGKTISVRAIAPIEGRRNFKGKLLEVLENADRVMIELETGTVNISLSEITEARVVPFEEGQGQETNRKKNKSNKGKGKDKGS